MAATRKGVMASSGQISDRALNIADVVRSVAQEIGATASQVALAVVLSDEHRARLDLASAPDAIFPSRFVGRPLVQQLIFGGSNVARRL